MRSPIMVEQGLAVVPAKDCRTAPRFRATQPYEGIPAPEDHVFAGWAPCSLSKEKDMQDYFYHPNFVSKPTNEFAATSSMKEKSDHIPE